MGRGCNYPATGHGSQSRTACSARMSGESKSNSQNYSGGSGVYKKVKVKKGVCFIHQSRNPYCQMYCINYSEPAFGTEAKECLKCKHYVKLENKFEKRAKTEE